MAKIYAPVKDYSGVSAGVSFQDGIGECSSPHLLKWFQEHGYKVEETQAFKENAGQEETGITEETKKRNRKPKE